MLSSKYMESRKTFGGLSEKGDGFASSSTVSTIRCMTSFM